MPNRMIRSTAHAAAHTLADVLASMFALELFAPSRAIYLISPWISDFVVLDNTFGQFRTLLPEYNDTIRLSSLLSALATQGTDIYVLTRPSASRDFIMRLHSSIQHKGLASLHEKSLLTDHFYLRGSMNFTYSGLNRNDEHVELTTEDEALAQARVNILSFWQGVAA
jgi:hypothetical protein